MLASTQIIKKTKEQKENANLSDYEYACQNFSWHEVEKELASFAHHKLNAAHIAVDVNAGNFRKNKIALYYESEQGIKEQYTFAQLSELSNQFANVLKKQGIENGQRVFIFLPRIPELFVAFLGILKVGAIAGTLFAAFQEDALFDRLENSGAKLLITNVELFPRVEKIWKKLPHLKKIVIVERGAFEFPHHEHILHFNKELKKADKTFHTHAMKKEDPAFMLYTSGTTGKPKGVVHHHAVVLQEYITAKLVLDLKEDDVYWCTADPGWITGISYEMLGPWANGASVLSFDGRFNTDRWYSILQEYKVSVWYTAPTAIRMLMSEGTEKVKKYNLSALRHMASVGEPLNPEAIVWGVKAFKLPFHDNWFQTELGAICIANFPSVDIKIGSMGKPFPGITAAIVDENGKEVDAGKEGNLVLKPNFPSLMKEIWKRPQKFHSYFAHGWYMSGDKAWKDKDGYFWFIGRADDIIKTSGERVGPFEVESALMEHLSVTEAGVIGKPDSLRGEIIKAFVVLKKGVTASDELKEVLQEHVKKHLAGHAYPREIEFVDKLPKTRSGKIMRRILKAKELGLPIGDTSTLEEY